MSFLRNQVTPNYISIDGHLMKYLKVMYRRKNENLKLNMELPYVKLAVGSTDKKSLNGVISLNNGTTILTGVCALFLDLAFERYIDISACKTHSGTF